MNFGSKLRKLREDRNMTQADLAKALGLSLKAVSNYELKGTRPRKMEMYEKISQLFQVDINYLLTDDSSFVLKAQESYGYQGAREAEELLNSMTGLFAGGDLPEEDKDALFEAIQEAYWEAKLENKKYGKKRD
ncbi:MAG: helix-turn-helix domain-containing protein [Bacillota bacterium]|nr:helix-turn-helix domain-containing protein [Bacillota bacterium]